ncbi:multidrug ABC transporter substrate-binding protein [Flavobacterium akiainvivens]|uniref:Multidrug ABC transporter substrate-binding protein n=1 Tax=Flavobacterium akiainvivens TaxID=1202724 RepID=A0A0M8M8A7_9FLAO|nr:FtsX-like permease family protein [Flavobacterium akiainvivens]KOS05593.1 multidrug ABC transporter substrate-binding protein [Flavobacterium akiainvivens]SFQ34970.1 putative ABC transport system permease protein [Flavobacterium akiainvivens]
MLKNWIKIFLYNVKNNKLFTALNILGLSLGIAGLVFALLYSNDEHSYNAWNPGKENIFFTVSDLGEDKVWGSSTGAIDAVRGTALPEVEEHCYMEGWYNSNIVKSGGKKVMAEKVLDAQANFFSFFPYEFVAGNAKTALTPNTMAISEAFCLKLFDTVNVLGKEVQYNDKTFTIGGVYRIEGKSSYMPEVVTNMIDWKLKEEVGNWGNFRFALFLKFKNPKDAIVTKQKMETLYYEHNTKLQAKADGITPDEFVKRFGKIKVILEPLKDIRLHSAAPDVPEGSGSYQLLVIMVGLSVLILIMSIANYINLATANAIKRAKGVGVRKIMGASGSNIIGQFVFETVITTLFSILLAMVIIEIGLPHFCNFLQQQITMGSSSFYLQMIGIFIVVVLLAGVFPAAYVSKYKPVAVLRGNVGRSKKGIWLRNAMLVLQFAIAAFFIIGSYIIYSQVNHMVSKDRGFKADQVVSIYYRNPYDFKVPGFKKIVSNRYDHVKERLKAIKGVESVAATTAAIGYGSSFFTSYGFNGHSYSLRNMVVDFSAIEMLNIKIDRGRSLMPQFADDTISSVILNEAAVKFIGIKGNPVGAYLDWQDGKKLQVVGVAKDFHIDGPQSKIGPIILYHYKTVDWMLQNAHHIYVKVNPQHRESAIAAMEKLWIEDIDPDFPFHYDFVDKNFAKTYAQFIRQRNVFSMLNVVVIVIALFGLFALASFSIERRMKEIAIRKTLGAGTLLLLKSLSKQYVVYCIIGFLIALVPAWILLDKWLQNFAYRIEVTILPFIIGFVVLLVLTLAVILGKAYKATRVDMVAYLKYE